jgi:antitoxin component YwqK of YwqJK toxin-antitoxin module
MRQIKILCAAFVTVFLCSCDNKEIEYYDNGVIKKEYYLKNDKFQGEYKEFYENGNLKVKHNYSDGILIDTSYYYGTDKLKKTIKVWSKIDTVQVLNFQTNGNIESEGFKLKDKIKIGKWKYYDKEKNLAKEIEYFNVSNKEYVNQVWYFDKEKNIVESEGNYMTFDVSNDTVTVYEPVKILIALKSPFFSYDSNVYGCIPSGKLSDLKQDFSNIEQIKLDTLPSIKNEKIIKDYQKYNLFVSFGLEFDKVGTQHIRGFISETAPNDGKHKLDKGKYNMLERKIYFDKVVYVKSK